MSALGSHKKAFVWTIEGCGRSNPVKISVQVEKGVMGKAEILVKDGDQSLFPIGTENSKASLTEDFVQRWNFCGRAAGLHESNFYEVQIAAEANFEDLEDKELPSVSTWHPATLTRQLADGTFEVLASVPDGSGECKQVVRSSVTACDLREMRTRKRIHVPWRYVKLAIPKANPLQAAVFTGNGEPILSLLAMPTPPIGGLDAELASMVSMRLDRTRSFLDCDISAAALEHFMSGEVRQGDSQVERWMKAWTLQLGPFAEHAVQIEKGDQMGVLRLTVDGNRLAEASAEDLNCTGTTWSISFCLVGTRFLEFVVHETNRNGVTLDSQGTVSQECSVKHVCTLHVPSTFDLSSAVLRIDGLEFDKLAHKVPTEGGGHRAHVEGLQKVYGIHVPYKINDDYTCNAQPAMLDIFASAPETKQSYPEPRKPTAPMELGIASWLDELKTIWHACTTPHRVPSEDGVPTPDYDRRPSAVPPSPTYGVKATW
jgi:hypothetical protein